MLKMGNKTSNVVVSDNVNIDDAVMTTVDSVKDVSFEHGAGGDKVQPALKAGLVE